MLAIFHKTFAHPPQELKCPESTYGGPPKPGYRRRQPKNPDEILRDFHSTHPAHSLCATFRCGAALACLGLDAPHPSLHHQRSVSSYAYITLASQVCVRSITVLCCRLFCSFDEVYCMFVGSLNNLSSLIRQYGLCSKSTNEALLVIQAYRTLRDRGPYPADQVLKELAGSFAFVVYDNKTGAVFAALVRTCIRTMCSTYLTWLHALNLVLILDWPELGRWRATVLGHRCGWVDCDL